MASTSVGMTGAAPAPRPSLMEKQNSVTMEYFLETSNLDANTTALLRKYDKDGNGSFSKDEVVAIILDLRDAMKSNENLGHYNRLFKRLLIAAVCFCVLLLASMFGLSYAVAALTAKTEVDSSGALIATDSHLIVATNSRADVHIIDENEDGKLCVTHDEIDIMTFEVAAGRNVMLEANRADGRQEVSPVSGDGFTIVNDDLICFGSQTKEGRLCWVHGGCHHDHTSGRRLSAEDRENMGLPPSRRLSDHDGQIQSQVATSGNMGSCGGKDDGYCCQTDVNNYCENLGLGLSGGDLNCKSNDYCVETD